ncbi:MAG: hypothetical protein IJX17_08890 [Clostridia bacterium]|nr:hypothetical protein [Clostridia bacterium]MBQ8426111.1 hypothetical protein [Clostridia bacterium]
MKKTVKLYTQRVVNGVVVGEYQDFTEKEFKKMLKSCHKQSKSHHKIVKNKKK